MKKLLAIAMLLAFTTARAEDEETVKAYFKDHWCQPRGTDDYAVLVGITCEQCFETWWHILPEQREDCRTAKNEEKCVAKAGKNLQHKIQKCVVSTFKMDHALQQARTR